MTLPTGDDVLDEAYQRLFAYGPEFEGYLSNHGPMVVEVLERRGRPEATHGWLDGYTARLEPAPSPRWAIARDEWREPLGDPMRVGDWLDFFEAEVRDRPWREVLLEWWPRLMPGAVGCATHGLIRTGHALRSLEAKETEWRVRELGAALGYWAARFHSLPATREPEGELDPADTLAQVPRIEDPQGDAATRVSQLTTAPSWHDALAGLRPPADRQQVPAELDALAAAAVSQYLDHGREEPVMLVHAATAPAAAAAALPSLPVDLWGLTWQEAWRASAAITACYAGATPGERTFLPPLAAEEILSRAIENGDEHLIKFTDVALLAHQQGCVEALPAASHAISFFE
ncbi:MAG: questin oxidase family protein [Acidimicrobiales bacterium]|jgi:hypothetical protein